MTICVEQALECTPEQAWQALSDPIHIRQWFFEEMPDFEAKVGFQIRFDVQAETQIFDHLWEVREVDPGKSMVVSWKYPPHDGEGLVKYEVEAHDSGSLARVTCDGIETFPQDIPEFRPESCRSGWEYFLQGRLSAYINDNPD